MISKRIAAGVAILVLLVAVVVAISAKLIGIDRVGGLAFVAVVLLYIIYALSGFNRPPQ